MLGVRRGDTLVEVIVAFTVFTLVAVGTNALMNRGVALAEQSLEITLVREQIDSEAALLKYARSQDSAIWSAIKANAATVTTLPDSYTTCPDKAPDNSFMLSIDTSGSISTLKYYDLTDVNSAYEQASLNSQFDSASDSPKFQGIWVIPIIADHSSGSNTVAYDLHIGTCWYVPGSQLPMTLGTIVRLYDRS